LVSYHIVPEKSFSAELEAMSIADQKIVHSKVLLLGENPFYPSLRTKKLHGTKYFESSANMSIRIIWEFVNELGDVYRDPSIRIISLLDVGQHDILKRY